MFEAGIQAARSKESPEIILKHEEFVDATKAGLVNSVLERLVANAVGEKRHVFKQDSVSRIIQAVGDKKWLKDSFLKQRETRFKQMLNLTNGKLQNETQHELEKLLTEWYRYKCGNITVSFGSHPPFTLSILTSAVTLSILTSVVSRLKPGWLCR